MYCILKDRTAILVTHNVAMAGKHASNFVTIASDGSISSTDTISSAVFRNAELMAEIKEETEAVAKAEEVFDSLELMKTKPEGDKPAGKLIVPEEKAEGRVSTRDSKCVLVCIAVSLRMIRDLLALVMLYLGSMGGTLFWISIWLTFMGANAINMYVPSVWFETNSVTPIAN